MLIRVFSESVNVSDLSHPLLSRIIVADWWFYRKWHYATVSVCRKTRLRIQLTEIQSGALMARMVVTSPDYTKSKYKLTKLKEIEEYVSSVVQVNIPVSTLKYKLSRR